MLAGTIKTDGPAHAAATRIQAHFRGRKVRAGLRQGVNDQGAADHPRTRSLRSSGQLRGKSCDTVTKGQASGLKVPHQPDIRKVISTTSFATAADYHRLVSFLEERDTRWPPRLQRTRIAVYLLFEEPRSSKAAQVLSMVILFCIIVSITVFMLETMPELDTVPQTVWFVVEVVCTAVFTLEYLLRLLVCDVSGRTVWRFIRAPMNLVDLFAILPFYLWLGMQHIEITKALGILRTIRLVRLFRIFKLGRYSSGLQLMIVALRNSSHALWVLSFFLGIGVVLFSSAIYYVEKMGCPDRGDLSLLPLGDGTNRTQLEHYVEECRLRPAKSNQYGICCTEYDAPLDFPTIIEAFWWSIVTMTTVGFGDVRPRTSLGKFVGTVTMLSGILLIALPIAIIGRKFQEAYAGRMESLKPCDGEEKCSTPQEASQLSMAELGRRLKLMRLPDAGLATLSRELAEELEEVGAVQKEIASMQAFEQARQLQALEHFGVVVTQFSNISKPTTSTMALSVAGAFRGSPNKGCPPGRSGTRSNTRSNTRQPTWTKTGGMSESSASGKDHLSKPPKQPDLSNPVPTFNVATASSSVPGPASSAATRQPQIKNVGG